jgi:hypothetical protein
VETIDLSFCFLYAKDMNRKQTTVVVIGIFGIAAAVFLTPRYKIVMIDSQNFIKTEQTSSLYKRSGGKEKLHWDRIALISGGIIIACGILTGLLKEEKNG